MLPKYTDPYTFRSGVTVRNRLLMSPMTTVQSFWDGAITHDEIHYYTARAAGLGAVITGAANVNALGKGWNGELSIASDRMLPGLSALASGIHSQHAKAFVQIFHAGRMTQREVLRGHQIVSASDVAALRPNAEQPRPLTIDEIHQTVADFGEATRRAIEAGFDGVELHGANTYLLQQFFSPHSNRRTDEYGSKDLPHRFQFIKEVLASVFAARRKYAKRPFVVGYRVSPEERETPGIRFPDTLWIVQQLAATELDYVHVSLGDYAAQAQTPQYQDQTMLGYIHAAIADKVPLIGVGGIRNRQDVENVLQHTEFAAVGQQLLFDPQWAVKLANGADETILQAPFKQLYPVAPFSEPLREYTAPRYRQ